MEVMGVGVVVVGGVGDVVGSKRGVGMGVGEWKGVKSLVLTCRLWMG